MCPPAETESAEALELAPPSDWGTSVLGTLATSPPAADPQFGLCPVRATRLARELLDAASALLNPLPLVEAARALLLMLEQPRRQQRDS